MAVFLFFSFGLQIGGLMHLLPLYLTSPLLFFALFILLIYVNNRKKFRGF
ncbi:membrane protein [Mesobacillus subterraneus]|uniref:Membrane protein n=1 Tax=Mesobacillus subterraneus TaxID=285983 RepID=A0A0D6Z6E4_9BACI|nr:membrane protein [Mesobacillus subterraneus]